MDFVPDFGPNMSLPSIYIALKIKLFDGGFQCKFSWTLKKIMSVERELLLCHSIRALISVFCTFALKVTSRKKFCALLPIKYVVLLSLIQQKLDIWQVQRYGQAGKDFSFLYVFISQWK